MRHDEFSITLHWRKPTEGSWPRPKIEGFYLTMGWANEGVAEWLADAHRVTPEQVERIAAFIADLLSLSTRTENADIVEIRDQAEERRQERLRYLRAKRQEAEDELAALGGEGP